MAALTKCYSLSQNVKKVADFTFHRLLNTPQSTVQCQSSKQFVTLSRLKPMKYQAPVRNFLSKRSPDVSGPRRFSQLLKPLGFTVLIGSTSFAALMVTIDQNKNPNVYSKKEINLAYVQFLKMVIGIIGINVGVFLLWRVPQLQFFMSKYFTSASGNPVISMLLSSFSHQSGFHLFVNMYVFWTFTGVLFNSIRRTEIFTWLYINGAIASSLAGLILKAVRFSPVSSVGASGAMLTCIACVCYAFPKATLGFPIISDLTGFYFTAETGLKGLILLDICGIIFGWRMLDHAGHLGGVLFGLWYMHYGRHQMGRFLQRVNAIRAEKRK